MKNRKVYLILILCLMFILLVFFIFSGIFSNSSEKITANVVSKFQKQENVFFESNCYDSDGTNYYEKGYREFKGKIQEEFCLEVESTGKKYVKEYYCYGELVQECPFDCIDGACVEEFGNKNILSNFLKDTQTFFRNIL